MEIAKTLTGFLQHAQGISHIVLTDRDGVPVACAGDDVKGRAQFISAYLSTVDQAARLGMGAQESSVVWLEQQQVIVFTLGRALFAFTFATTDANTGAILLLRDKMGPLVKELHSAIPELALRAEEADAH